MRFVQITYTYLKHFPAGDAPEVAGCEDKIVKGEAVPNHCFKNAQPGDYCILYCAEKKAVVGIGVVTEPYYRDAYNLYWDMGIYPNRIGMRVLAFHHEGVPLDEIREDTGVTNPTFLYIANNVTDTEVTTKVNQYILDRFDIRNTRK